MSIGINLSSLEKSVNCLAKALRSQGYKCSVYKFVDDSRGGSYGGSRIGLTVESDEVYGDYEFFSIYGGFSRDSFSGQSMKWSEIKLAVIKDINDQTTKP